MKSRTRIDTVRDIEGEFDYVSLNVVFLEVCNIDWITQTPKIQYDAFMYYLWLTRSRYYTAADKQ